MSMAYPRVSRQVVERWLARPFSAESFATALTARVAMVFAVISLSFSAQIAISQIVFAFTEQQTVAHHALAEHSAAMQFFAGSILAPLLETLLVQVPGVFILRRLLRANWTISCIITGCIFGALHGYRDSALLKLSIAGILLTAVFVIEKRKKGKPIRMTFAAHSLYNTILWLARN